MLSRAENKAMWQPDIERAKRDTVIRHAWRMANEGKLINYAYSTMSIIHCAHFFRLGFLDLKVSQHSVIV